MPPSLPYAQDVNYWMTGSTAWDTLIDRAARQIREVGGRVTGHGHMMQDDREAIMLSFELEGVPHRIVWPVLPVRPVKSKAGVNSAARIQAATYVFHDVKAKCMVAKIMGAGAAFAPYQLLPGGDTVADRGFRGLEVRVPQSLLLGSGE